MATVPLTTVKYMNYDTLTKMYILDPKYMLEVYGKDLTLELVGNNDDLSGVSADMKLKSFLFRASLIIYTYIYNCTIYKQYIDWCLITKKPMIESLRAAIGEMLNYWCESGYDITTITPINQSGNLIDLSKQALIPPTVEFLLSASKLSFRGKWIYESAYYDYLHEIGAM